MHWTDNKQHMNQTLIVNARDDWRLPASGLHDYTL